MIGVNKDFVVDPLGASSDHTRAHNDVDSCGAYSWLPRLAEDVIREYKKRNTERKSKDTPRYDRGVFAGEMYSYSQDQQHQHTVGPMIVFINSKRQSYLPRPFDIPRVPLCGVRTIFNVVVRHDSIST